MGKMQYRLRTLAQLVFNLTGHWYIGTRPTLLLGAILFYLIASAASAEWTVTPVTQVGGTYESNFNRTKDAEELYRATFTAGLSSTVETDRWSTVFNGLYNGTRAIGRSDLNQDTGTVDVLSSYLTENSTWELNGGVAITEPNSSELETGAQEFDIVTRINWHVGPAWNWSINQQNSLRLAYDYASVAYSDEDDSGTGTAGGNFDDFTAHTASAQLTHQYTESTQLTGDLSFIETENESDTERSKTDQFILQLGGNYAFSDTFDMSLSAGGIYVISKQSTLETVLLDPTDPLGPTIMRLGDTDKSTELGYIVSVTGNKAFNYGTLSATFVHNFSPTLNGGLTELNALTVNYTQQLSETLTGNIGVLASESDELQSTVSASGRRNISADIGLDWQFYQNWSLNGGYRYQWLDRDDDSTTFGTTSSTTSGVTTNHVVFVNLGYNWTPFTILQ